MSDTSTLPDLIEKLIRFPEDHVERIDELKRDDESLTDYVRSILEPFLAGRYEAIRDADGNVTSIRKGKGEPVELSPTRRQGGPRSSRWELPDGHFYTTGDLVELLGVTRQRIQAIAAQATEKGQDPGEVFWERISTEA